MVLPLTQCLEYTQAHPSTPAKGAHWACPRVSHMESLIGRVTGHLRYVIDHSECPLRGIAVCITVNGLASIEVRESCEPYQ